MSGIVPLPAFAAPADGGSAPSPQQVEAVAEQYNLARLKVERASALIVETDRRIDAAKARVALVTDRVRARAAAIYRGAGSPTAMPIGDVASFSERARHRTYLDAAERPDRDLLDTLSSELRRLRTEEASQRDAKALLQHDLDSAAQLKRKLADLAAAAAARAKAAADAAGPVGTPTSVTAAAGAAGTTTTTVAHAPNGGGGTTTPPATAPAAPPPPSGGGNAPPPSSGAATAVAYARAQLGKPYVFATAGPNTFDCSGLTMAAWAAAGVRMPHYSGSQATMFPKVTWDQLQPGDIVVFYSDLHHVGLYIGGGMMIHAPQTGDVVKIAPAWRTTFQWGVRPR
ncbi:MAG: NlpC/P60 family protein [Acidimicrobiia bacterium]